MYIKRYFMPKKNKYKIRIDWDKSFLKEQGGPDHIARSCLVSKRKLMVETFYKYELI
jgi:hypothetical protein